MTEIPLWERQEGETDKAYEAFALYRDMGASRSIPKVREKLGKNSGYDRQLEKWSSALNWVERALAWDDKSDERARERNEQRRIQVEQNAWKDYSAIRKAIEKRVDTFETANWAGDISGMQALLDLMRKADDLARRTVGLPDKITESKSEIEVQSMTGLKIILNDDD